MSKFTTHLGTLLLALLPAWGAAQTWDASFITSGSFNAPMGLAVDASGNHIYIASRLTGDIQRFFSNGDGNYAPLPEWTGFNSPYGLALKGTSILYVANTSAGAQNIQTIQLPNNPYITTKPLNYAPDCVAVDGEGNIYVCDANSGVVRKYMPGSFQLATLGRTEPGSRPRSVAVDGTGNVFVADFGNGDVIKHPTDGNGGYLAPQRVVQGVYSYGVAVDSAGNLFVADVSHSTVTQYAPGSSGYTLKSTVMSGLNIFTGAGVAVDGAGNVYISDTGNDRIVRAVARASVAVQGTTAAAYGQPVTFTATVTPGNTSTPGGTVAFYEGANLIGTGPVSGGQAQVSTTALNAGTHNITATYSGDVNNGGAASAAVQQVVTQAAQAITFTNTPVPYGLAGGGYTVSATGGASGNAVTFSAAGACTLAGSTVGFTATGTCIVTARQAGNANYAAAPDMQQTTTIGSASFGGATPPYASIVSGGGSACQFDPTATSFTAASAVPPGKTAPQGMFRFKLVGCTPGSTVTVSTTWPQPVAEITKYGKANAGDTSDSFFAVRNPQFNGSTLRFDVQDGVQGDDDWTQDGTILDPVMPLAAAAPVGGAAGIPTLGEWGLLLLSALLALVGWRQRFRY